MKQFEPHKKDQDQVKSHEERNVADEITYHEARMLHRPGMTVFEYNRKTGILRKAVFEEVNVEMVGDKVPDMISPAKEVLVKKKIKEQAGCMYFQKLNFKNAVKMVNKLGFTKILIQNDTTTRG